MLDGLIQHVRSLFAGERSRLAGVPEPGDEAVVLFLDGNSVPMCSALVLPSIGGPELIREQRRIEARIRAYIAELGDLILQQQEEIAQLADEIIALQASIEAQAVS